MPSPEKFRKQFKRYLGVDVYLRFVAELHKNKGRMSRLRYWQQDLWESFVSDNPDYDLPKEALVDALNVCELHGNELTPVEVPVFRGCLDFTEDYINDTLASFPHATIDQVMVPEDYTESTCTTWVCSKCDEILNASR